ncbi:hypothetical protein [Actinotalea sp. K2]|uniref:hypothetical protein n=1 Tax=Actinotalea sp. K2 TaxID=2939438 RepID=UPI002017E941|nr:hypothetical protein [Actinotalea sp. K2]MCL3861632.1 hypothetical protein [Actinotalea sp. K2]
MNALHRLVRDHTLVVVVLSALVATAGSLARDHVREVRHAAGAGMGLTGWELGWLAVTVVAGLVALHALTLLTLDRRRATPPGGLTTPPRGLTAPRHG